MKKFLISTLLLAGWTGHAASLPDSVAMTVGDKKVSVAEFLFSAEKNGETDLADKKNLESFVQLFGNFKLKVVDAEAQGLDQTQAFKDELDRYKAELLSSYLSDKEAEDAVRKIDKQRKKYYDTYTGRNWGAPENYDFCINSSVMGIEETAEQIITWARGTW